MFIGPEFELSFEKLNGLSQRVAIENENVVIYKEHAPCRYHGYIEENPKNMHPDFEKSLVKAKLIQPGKKIRIRK